MIRNWLFFGLALLVFNACVPAKKLVYLQKEDELKKRKDIPTDTILRSHVLGYTGVPHPTTRCFKC